jgi:arsenate reductase
MRRRSASVVALAIAAAALAAGWTRPARSGEPQELQVLFVCEHGNVKSLMAASYFNQMARERKLPFRAISRGSAPDSTTVPPAIIAGLRQESFEVADFHPAAVAPADVAASRQLVLINSELPASTLAGGISTERWLDVPPASVNYPAARDSLRAHVARLIDRLTLASAAADP